MLTSLIQKLFLTKWDEFESAYVSNGRLNDFYYNASSEVFKDLMSQYQLSNRITEDILVLVQRDVMTPTSNLINLTTDITNYNTLINIFPKYTTDAGDIQYPAKPFLAEEKLSFYAKGSQRYPRFDQYTNTGGNTILQLYPSITPDQVQIDFFKNPLTVDFDQPTVDIPYTENTINLITDKALQLAASAFRDGEFFNTSTTILQQANSPTN